MIRRAWGRRAPGNRAGAGQRLCAVRSIGLVLVLTACGAAPMAPASPPASPRAPRVFFVEQVGGEAFVLLGTSSASAPDVAPVLVGDEEDEVRLARYPGSFDVPELTPVGLSPCAPQRGEPVLLRRVVVPEWEEHHGSPVLHEAVRIDAACEPQLAIEGRRADAWLVTFEWEEVELGEPIPGVGPDGWSAVLRYAPGEDGLCPGFPSELVVTPPAGQPERIEFGSLLARIDVLAASDGFWVMLAGPTSYQLHAFPGGETGPSAEYPTGVDLAEECL